MLNKMMPSEEQKFVQQIGVPDPASRRPTLKKKKVSGISVNSHQDDSDDLEDAAPELQAAHKLWTKMYDEMNEQGKQQTVCFQKVD